MPDIEMHGPWDTTSYVDTGTLQRAIKGAFASAAYRNDVQINNMNSWSTLLNGITYAPFLRVYMTREYPHFDDVLQRLKALNLDIEVAFLDRFIPHT